MDKSKKLREQTRIKAKYAIETISLLILCGIIAILGGNLFANMQNRNIENTEERIENTETEIYIYDAYDMKLFRDSVNAGNSYVGKTVNVMKDIDLTLEENGTWEPIGTGETNFAGTFNGRYHKIKNININTNKQQTVGFFKETEKTTIIKNTILENVNITSNYEIPANNAYIGGLVGWNSEGAQIINCGIKSGKIQSKIGIQNANNTWYGPVIGGIAGRSNGIIDGCYNKAEIKGEGITNGNYTEAMVGGLVGAGRGKVSNSYNTGSITGTSYTSYVGGIAGNADNTYTGKIENTYNKGKVNITGTSKYIGGIIGRNGWRENYEAMEIENTYATNSTINTENKYNGTGIEGITEGKITEDELKTYTIKLGEKYVYDINNINDKDPILYWEAEYPEKAKLNINQTYIKAGQKIQLTVQPGTDETSNPDGVEEHPSINDLNNSEFTWTSTNKDIAEVDGNGLVTGLKDGYTSIYATHKYTDEEGNEKTILAECIINVNQEKATPQIGTGNGFTVVLKSDGTVWKVGNQDINTNNIEGHPECTPTQIKINETENLENVVKIAVGTNEILALTKDGEIYTYNINDEYAIKNVTLTNIVDISAGNNTFIALDKNGNVYTWTNETQPTKQTIENIIRISAGSGNVSAIESNGLLWIWGENGKGQLGLNCKTNLEYPIAVETEVTEVSSGGIHTIIQKIDKKLYATGDMYQTAIFEDIILPETVTNTNPVKYFKTGQNTTTIMLQNGSIYGEGGNTRGELGIGTNENAGQFTQGLTLDTSNNSVTNGNPDNVGTHRVHPLEDALIIGDSSGNGETSSLNTAVILENGNIYITGDNTNGQIGDGTTESKNHYTKMGYAELDYEEKEIILDETGYQIDINKLKYNETTLNVYDNNIPIEIGKLEYTSSNTNLAEVDEKGFITARNTSGTAEITIRDIDNGKETKITVLVNRLLVDTDTVKYIYNIEDLAKFRDSVNAGDDYAGKTVYVMADIDMNPACSEKVGSWTPIGATGTNFAGTFDGNYHTLSNFYYNSNVYNYVGLFAENDGIIQNLILDNVYIYNTYVASKVYTGGIASINTKVIQNCGIKSGYISGALNSGSFSSWSDIYVGGIVGTCSGGIYSCYNKATIYSNNMRNNYSIVYSGGIAGYKTNEIYNCYNIGSCTGTSISWCNIGGIVAFADNISMNGCYNIGKISASSSGNYQREGGLIGCCNSSSFKISESYCTTETLYALRYGAGYGTTVVYYRVNKEELRNYASILGVAYENDDFNINDGYPILWWEAPAIELNKKQAYIKTGENLQLDVVGAHCNVPVENLDNVEITDFKWNSTNEDIATINENGQVTGLKEGYTTIYGTHKEYENVDVMCVVNVAKSVNVATPQIETGNGFTAILKADGTVWMTGNEETKPAQIKINENTYLENVIKISAGANHVLALTKDGEVYAWGKNDAVQLGIGNNENTTYATKVTGEGGASTLKRIVDISAGETGSTAINEFGWMYVWGNGTNGEFGNGETTSSNTPVKTVVNNGISASTGEGHVVALGQNGKLYTWGKNNAGQLGIGNTTNNTIIGKIADGITDISAGGNQTIVKDIEGNIYGTGQNTNGQLGIGTNTNVTTLTKITIPDIVTGENNNTDTATDDERQEGAPTTKVKYIKAGTTNTTILLNDGTVWSTGININGELGNGNNDNSSTFVQGLTLLETDNTEINNPDDVGAHSVRQLEDVLTIGRNTGLNTAVILENGDVYATGDNTYLQISDNKIASTNYYKKIEYINLDYADKIIEIDQTGYTIDKNKLKYLYETLNVYNQEEQKELTIGEIEYEPLDTNLIKINQNGYITPLKKEGTTELKIRDITNGYETEITIKVKTESNTDTVTYIYNIDDLVKFRDNVNAGNDYAGKTVYVMADIDMSTNCSETVGSWTPIGATGTIFEGTFDGNYHTLSNFYYNSNSHINVGLFAKISTNAIVQNIVLKDIYINNTKSYIGQITTGAIAGISSGKINNVGVESGSIIGNNSAQGNTWSIVSRVGGIVGNLNEGNINCCYNKATIYAYAENGMNDYKYVQVGGIAGISRSNITNSYNIGTINAFSHEIYVGGIAGRCYTDNSSKKGLILNSYNIGFMGKESSYYGSNGYIGGIAGMNDSSNYRIEKSYYSVNSCTYSCIYRDDGSTVNKYLTEGKIEPQENLKNYAKILGTAYENDDFGINDGYPILWWEAGAIELNKKQAYIKVGENLQLDVVGAHCNVPVENLDNVEITDFTWKSSNKDIAEVNENGQVTGIKEGYATIYGTHKEYENIHVMCIVNVSGKENIATPQIETGNGFTAILKADGTVWMTGNEDIVNTGIGGCPEGAPTTEETTNIATNNNPDDVGAIINRPHFGEPAQIKINENTYLENVIKISAGANHVLALTKDGEVYAWGKNEAGQLGIGNNENTTYATKVTGEGGASTLKRIVDITAGETGSTAINEFGWVFVWGNGTQGEFGNGGTTSSNTPVKTVVNHGISASIGEGHVVALGQNGKLYTWGKNNAGQLGIENTTNNTIVGKIAEGITEISAGGNKTIVKDIEGNIYGTGQNTNGELGIGTNTNVTTLTKITIPDIITGENNNTDTATDDERPEGAPTTKVKYIKSGKTNTTILLNDGTVWSTGINTNGELGQGDNENSNVFVQGMTFVENNDENGADTEPVPTEENDNPDALTPQTSPLTSVVFIGRNNGSLNTVVILENGSMYGTGDNTYSQITNEIEEGTNYYVPMIYKDIIAPEEIELQVGDNRTLTPEELIYKKDTINVYKQDILEIPLIDYTQIEDEKIATYEKGRIEAIEVGTTKLKVEEEIHDILIYIPVKVYGKIVGSITTENHEGKHIANVTLYETEDTRPEEKENTRRRNNKRRNRRSSNKRRWNI